jgi:hypothetical protein
MTRLFGLGALLAAFVLAMGPAGVTGQDREQQKKGLFGKGDPEAMFKKLDADGDGKLTKKEFLKVLEPIKDMLKDKLGDKAEFLDKVMDRMWQQIDPDGKGVTLDQFKERMGKFKDFGKDLFKKKKKADAE